MIKGDEQRQRSTSHPARDEASPKGIDDDALLGLGEPDGVFTNHPEHQPAIPPTPRGRKKLMDSLLPKS